jgi:hypothetical protein
MGQFDDNSNIHQDSYIEFTQPICVSGETVVPAAVKDMWSDSLGHKGWWVGPIISRPTLKYDPRNPPHNMHRKRGGREWLRRTSWMRQRGWPGSNVITLDISHWAVQRGWDRFEYKTYGRGYLYRKYKIYSKPPPWKSTSRGGLEAVRRGKR